MTYIGNILLKDIQMSIQGTKEGAGPDFITIKLIMDYMGVQDNGTPYNWNPSVNYPGFDEATYDSGFWGEFFRTQPVYADVIAQTDNARAWFLANYPNEPQAMAYIAQTTKQDSLPTGGNSGQYVGGDFLLHALPGTNTRSFATPTRTIGTSFQISTTRDSSVVYSIPVTSNATLLAGSQVSATLQYADNSGMSTNVVTLPGDNFGIALGLLASGIGSLKLVGTIPAGKFVKITTTNIAGTPTLGTMTAQEVLI